MGAQSTARGCLSLGLSGMRSRGAILALYTCLCLQKSPATLTAARGVCVTHRFGGSKATAWMEVTRWRGPRNAAYIFNWGGRRGLGRMKVTAGGGNRLQPRG